MDNRINNIKNNINNCINNNDITYYKSFLIFLYIRMIIFNSIIIGNDDDDIYMTIILDLIFNSFMIYYLGLTYAVKIYIWVTVHRFITCCEKKIDKEYNKIKTK